MSTAGRVALRFRVGDWVVFRYGVRQVWAKIIEDRGPLDVNRQRIYRVRLTEDGEANEFETSETGLSPAPPPDAATIADYLSLGGLVAILQSNLTRRRDQPRVWLSFQSNGELTHTFDEGEGFLGGATVPYFALLEDHVFRPKSREVIELIRSFGLDETQAENVLESVGTAP